MNEKAHQLHPVPPPNLSPAQILELAKSECQVWLEILPERTRGLFQIFAQSIITLSESTEQHGVERAINAIGEHCLKYAEPLENAAKEIERRKSWLTQVSEIQTSIEERREEIDEERLAISNLIRFDKDTPERRSKIAVLIEKERHMHSHIDMLLTLRSYAQNGLDTLERFLRSFEFVEKGYSRDLLNVTLPNIPDYEEEIVTPPSEAEIATGTANLPKDNVQETGEIHPSNTKKLTKAEKAALRATADIQEGSNEPVALSEQRIKLRKIAIQHGFLEVEVLAYSLYDLLDEGNRRIGTYNKGRTLRRVFASAADVFPGYEHFGAHKIPEMSEWKDESIRERGFLKYCGNAFVAAIWQRSNKPLPWNASSLFSGGDIEKFILILNEKKEVTEEQKQKWAKIKEEKARKKETKSLV